MHAALLLRRIQGGRSPALEKKNFKVPKSLKGIYTNAIQDKPFDQIAFLSHDVASQMDVARTGAFSLLQVGLSRFGLEGLPARHDRKRL
jgi:hypothetical protein